MKAGLWHKMFAIKKKTNPAAPKRARQNTNRKG